MYEFIPFKKTDKLSYESFIQFPRELLNREEYKILSPKFNRKIMIFGLSVFHIFFN